MKHTPGPWRIDFGNHKTYDGEIFPKDGHFAIMTDKGNFDCEIAQIGRFSGGDGNKKGNAFLIAAAPDLLQVAKDALRLYSDMTSHQFAHGCDIQIREQLGKAIAKAEGK